MQHSKSIIAGAVVLMFHQVVFAHAYPDHAQPKAGEIIKASPSEIKIWFTVDIRPSESAIVITDPAGKQVNLTRVHGDDADKTLLCVPVSNLEAGLYTVTWHVVAHDGHKTKGDYTFEIRQ